MQVDHVFEIDGDRVEVTIYGTAAPPGGQWTSGGVWQIDRGTVDIDAVVRRDTREDITQFLTDKQITEAEELLVRQAVR